MNNVVQHADSVGDREGGTSLSAAHTKVTIELAGTGQDGPCGEDHCGVRELLDRLGDKWTVLVMVELSKGTRRFGELQRAIPGISQRMLTRTTKQLWRDGFVDRTAYQTIPPQVEYSLTEMGLGLLSVGMTVIDWTRDNVRGIETARAKWDVENAAPMRFVEPRAVVTYPDPLA
ncbi:transcriptional regulator [Nocardia sp. SYP-A9097]|uniref:winged helix-turn-helix transcriptional regulator n=1 Tax=Nocardia sp. SYP-A9097 TaxID=2663237 RepID=UPI00129BA43B|nr:helix-turn-helix domain-containing protein [Nocardia sp. SYP-A9097]MRH88571.1 transcriptional regulator [Nocardia sp. SYP-A9097]